MPRFLSLSLSLSIAACSGSHDLPITDAGSPPGDAGPTTRACHLASPAPTPAFAGEGCYCDGPFVVRGDLAYRQSYMLEVIDVSMPGAPRLVGSVAQQAVFSTDVDVVGDVLFASGGVLERFDLSDPRAPLSLGTTDVGGNVEAMTTLGARMAVAITREDMTHAIVPIDVTDPRAPIVGTAVELGPLSAGSLAMRGTTVLAAALDTTVAMGTSRIVAVDVADVHAARTVGTLDAPVDFLASAGVHDTRLFVGGIETGVHAYDVSDPTSMRDLGVVIDAMPGAQAVAVSGDVLVVSGSGLALYDLASPSLAFLGRTDPTSDSPHAIVTGTQLLGSGGNALFSVPLTCD
jgi:hypothetical protein